MTDGKRSSETGTWTLIVTPPIASTTFLKPSKLTSTKYLMSRPYRLPEHRLEAVVAGEVLLRVAREQVVALADRRPERVDLARVDRPERLAGRSRRDRHVDRVARQAEHRDLLGDRIDRHHDQGVGVVGALARPLVAADEQDVEPLLAVPRRDRDVGQGAAGRGRLGLGAVGRLGGVPSDPSDDPSALGWLEVPGTGWYRRRSRRIAADEDAVAVEDVEGQHVVAGDHDVAAGHDQHDRQQAGDRQRVVADPRTGRRDRRPTSRRRSCTRRPGRRR